MASHFTFCEREILYRLLKAKESMSEIEELMGRDRSTIYRELKRNTASTQRFLTGPVCAVCARRWIIPKRVTARLRSLNCRWVTHARR